MFPAWSTQVAQNGYCVLSRAPNDIVFAANLAIDKLAYSLVPDLPVEVFTPNFKVRGTPHWFGPPAFRIPVGGRFAIPGPSRDKSATDVDGGGMPGNYHDFAPVYFTHIQDTLLRDRASFYGQRWMTLLRQESVLYTVAGGVSLGGGFNLRPDLPADENMVLEELARMHHNVNSTVPNYVAGPPANHAALQPEFWAEVVSNFQSAPYAYLRTHWQGHNYQNPARERWRLALRENHCSIDERYKFKQSPYQGNMMLPSNPAPGGRRFTCDGRVNRKFKAIVAKPVYTNGALPAGNAPNQLHHPGNWVAGAVVPVINPYPSWSLAP